MSSLSIIRNLLVCLCGLVFFPCCTTQDEPKSVADPNNSKIRILAIGNSFTENATYFLPEILSDTYSQNDVFICKATKGGTSLEDHWKNFETSYNEYKINWTVGFNWNFIGNNNLNSILQFTNWDIIIIQQVSGLSGIPESFFPYLTSLTSKIRQNCPNVLIGWQMTWSYSRDSRHPDFINYNNNSEEMLEAIRRALGSVKPYVDLIIPSGELINSLRQTEFNTASDLTIDGYHLDNNLPRFALSCLWHEILISSFTGLSCSGTSLSPDFEQTFTAEEKEVITKLIEKVTKN